jgi:hypothetical protein
MPSQAVDRTLLAWLCETQAALGCIAGRGGGRGPDRTGNRGPVGWHESCHVGQKSPRAGGLQLGGRQQDFSKQSSQMPLTL